MNKILVCPLFCEHDEIVGTMWIQASSPKDAQARGSHLMSQLSGHPGWKRNE